MIKKIAKNIISRLLPSKKMDARQAYDHWSAKYDHEPFNLVKAIDEKLFNKLFLDISITGKTVIDVGCGTGRHWKTIIAKEPAKLVGYDVSSGMLEQLKQKYPGAETHLLHSNHLHATADLSADLIISTLTIGYIKDVGATFSEWNRVLKPGGELIITDFHPETLSGGAKRTFDRNNRQVEIKNYIHTFAKMREWTALQGWQLKYDEEMVIDDAVKGLFIEKNMLQSFDKFNGMKLVYGMHLIKTNVVTQP